MTAPVYLINQSDWNRWFDIAKAEAINYEVWQLVDPDGTLSQATPKPEFPELSDIREGVTSVKDLSSAEIAEYNLLINIHNSQQRRFNREMSGLISFRTFLTQTVKYPQFSELLRNTSSQEIMKALKARFGPTGVDNIKMLRMSDSSYTPADQLQAETARDHFEEAHQHQAAQVLSLPSDFKISALPAVEKLQSARDIRIWQDNIKSVLSIYELEALLSPSTAVPPPRGSSKYESYVQISDAVVWWIKLQLSNNIKQRLLSTPYEKELPHQIYSAINKLCMRSNIPRARQLWREWNSLERANYTSLQSYVKDLKSKYIALQIVDFPIPAAQAIELLIENSRDELSSWTSYIDTILDEKNPNDLNSEDFQKFCERVLFHAP